MVNKIIRVIAILLTSVAACVVLPMIFNMFFSPHSEHHEVTYSELLGDFITSEYEYHTEGGKLSVTTVFRDSRGNIYTPAQADSLCPLDNVSQLAYDEKFPDSICGKAVEAKIAHDAKFRMNITGNRPGLFYGLSELKDRKSAVSTKYETGDLFRINKHGIEFIDAAKNSVDTSKSIMFNTALTKLGFEAPAAIWWSPADRTDFEKTGYLVIDNKGDLFNLAMEDRKQDVKKVASPEGKKISAVNFSNRPDFLAVVVAEDGSSYVLDRDMHYAPLPIPSLKGTSATLQANLMFHTFIIYGDDETSYHVLDRNYKPVKDLSVRVEKEISLRDEFGSYLFPLRIYQSAARGTRIIFGNPLHFIWLNIALAALTYYIKRRKGYPANDIFSLIDIVMVLIFGIFGMAGVFAIPQRKKSRS